MGALTVLHGEGLRIKDTQNQEVRVRGIDGYSMIHDVLIGEVNRLDEYLHWASSYGVINGVRRFNLWWNLNLSPRRAGYWDAVATANALCKKYGLYVWQVALCDQVPGSPVMLSPTELAAYWTALATASDDVPLIDEIMNEPWQNGDFAGQLHPVGTFSTRGAANDSQLPDAPGKLLNFTTHHTPRGDQQTRKAKELVDVAKLGFDHWAPSGICALAGEPPHINVGEWTDPQRCADYYALCDLFGNGGVIHGDYAPDNGVAPLQSCVIPTNATSLACIDAIVETWKHGVPLGTFAEGKYLRGTAMNDGDLGINHYDRYTDFGENPEGALRTFAMALRLPNGKEGQVIVPVDRGPKWQDAFGMRNNFTLAEVRGTNGNVLIVER